MNIQVKGEGSLASKIVLVGEAPGADEARLHRPFIGASGRELDRLLGGASLVRASCYLTNVVKERPINNNISPFCERAGRDVEMSKSYHEYEAYLYDELAALKPNIIVPLGNVALWAVAREWGITKWRGSVIPSVKNLGSVKVMPTIHPAATLRNFIWKYFVARDFARAAKEAAYPDIQQTKRIYHTSLMFGEAVELLRKVKASNRTACDIEVVNYELACIGFSLSATESFCIPFHSLEHNDVYYTLEQETELMLLVEEILGDDSIIKVWQNGIFDTSFLYEKYGIVSQNNRDTLIATGLLHPDFPRSLAFQCSMFTDLPYYKEEGKDPDGAKLAHGRDKVYWEYNCKDVCATDELDQFYEPKLKASGNWETYLMHCRCIQPCTYMQARGLVLDTEGVKASMEQVDIDMKKHYEELDLVMKRPVPRTFATSPKQKLLYFYEELGIKPYMHKGSPSCNAIALKKIARRVNASGKLMKGAREAQLVAEISTLRKLKGSYLEVALDEDKRLRGAWNPLGTETGRFSCSKVWRG